MFVKIKLQVYGGDGVVINISDVKMVLGEGYACVKDSDGVEVVTVYEARASFTNASELGQGFFASVGKEW
jgi:hypothetical protein